MIGCGNGSMVCVDAYSSYWQLLCCCHCFCVCLWKEQAPIELKPFVIAGFYSLFLTNLFFIVGIYDDIMETGLENIFNCR